MFAANYFYEKSVKDCHPESKSWPGSALVVPHNDKYDSGFTLKGTSPACAGMTKLKRRIEIFY
jgi:hypothetical protein